MKLMTAQSPISFLHSLASVHGPSGREDAAIHIWCQRVQPFSDAIHHDDSGTATAVLQGHSRRQVVLVAHIDEVSLVVTSVDESGQALCSAVGGLNQHLLPGRLVRVHTSLRVVRGVTSVVVRPLAKHTDATEDCCCAVDFGCNRGEQSARLVSPGDMVTFERTRVRLARHVYAGGCYDNRAGCWAVAETMRSLEETRPLTVFGAIIPGEETGRVQPWPQHVPKQPDVVIVVDAIHATDVHGVQASSVGEVLLGKGPTLLRASDDSVCNAVEDVANRNNLPVQVVDYGKPYRPPLHMPFAHSHTPAVVSLGFPVRYMHTSVEIIDVRDVRNLHALLTAFCQDLADT